MNIYGIVAHPVSHSVSPAMQQAAFDELGIVASYHKFDIVPEELATFVKKVRTENISGLSVSIPHKINIMPLLDEIDPLAQKVGAVNTVLNSNNKLIGFNTDLSGAVTAIKEKLPQLSAVRTLILGSGGAAHAIACGLKEEGAMLTIYNPEINEARRLADKLEATATAEIPDLTDFDLLINATPVGMEPNDEESLIMANNLHAKLTVFDAVYKPRMTRLLTEAAEAGAQIITGDKMLLYQGTKQFEIWTNKPAPIQVMETALKQALS